MTGEGDIEHRSCDLGFFCHFKQDETMMLIIIITVISATQLSMCHLDELVGITSGEFSWGKRGFCPRPLALEG